jgi:hypothetical protein
MVQVNIIRKENQRIVKIATNMQEFVINVVVQDITKKRVKFVNVKNDLQ